MRRLPEKYFEKFGEDGEEADKNKNKAALPLPPGGSTAPLGAPAMARIAVMKALNRDGVKATPAPKKRQGFSDCSVIKQQAAGCYRYRTLTQHSVRN